MKCHHAAGSLPDATGPSPVAARSPSGCRFEIIATGSFLDSATLA